MRGMHLVPILSLLGMHLLPILPLLPRVALHSVLRLWALTRILQWLLG